MRRPLINAVVSSACLIAASAVVASAHSLAAPSPGGTEASAVGAQVADASAIEGRVAEAYGFDTFLGFEVGEERRYIIAPDNAMRDGEEVTWSVRLDRLEQIGDRTIGIFALGHEESRVGVAPRGGISVVWKYSGEARINEYGFPEEVSFSMFEEHTGEAPWRGEIMSASYTFNGKEYSKTVRVPDQEWEFRVPIATHDALDLDLPVGMFLFRPRAAGVDFFTNPALLGFALPEVIPDSWQQRTMFFQPDYPVRYPNEDYIRRERDTREALGRYYVKQTLKMGEPTELEIGGRVLNVRRLEITGPLRNTYVDEFGRVVRIDIDPDPITRQNRYIRLLFPSEY